MSRILIFLSFLFIPILGEAQNEITLKGTVRDADTKQVVDFATVYIENTNIATETDLNGQFELVLPNRKWKTLIISRLGYEEYKKQEEKLQKGETRVLEIFLTPQESDVEIIVSDSKIEETAIVREEVTELKLLPSTTGNLESVLPHIALGTTSGTGGELSSQYNVRGGNYDENLVYVNDFEIYRPQLIRAGQQEGLTFPNIDLIRDLSFSSGGFQSKYGDKLSSVLDVRYKRPEEFRASVGGSLLGASAHIEGSKALGGSNYRKFRYLVGARYKTTKYLLGSLDVTGEYTPSFADFQGYFTYDINRDWQLGVLANYNTSIYEFVPQTRTTALGLINFALELFTVFEGQEVDDFTTGTGGVSLTYLPERDKNPLYLKFLASRYQSSENERFDIIGFYRLGEIETNLGSDDAGEVVNTLGTGTQQQFVRNYLFSNVTNIQHKGGIEFQLEQGDLDVESSHFVQWGAKYQREEIFDEINEWERLDSAGYSLTFDETQVLVREVLKTENELKSNRVTAFVQNTYTHKRDSVGEYQVTAGVRANYWDLNNEFLISPRVQFLYSPLKGKKDISYRLSGGLYYQPAFYREMRRLDGSVNTNLKAQKSAHFVAGMTYDFLLGKKNPKDFRFIVEAYYKQLWDVVSYDLDNVRIRYSGENDATGYVAGLDMRINGEFVPGAESWINLSFLRARESLNGVQHLRREIGDEEAQEVADVPRPTDQFMTLSMFFQDYLPRNENFKMHLNLTVGTGFPYGLKGNNVVYRNTYRYNPYSRVDIGFSVLLWNESRKAEKPKHFLRFSRNTWLSLEVFNLMAIQNAASTTWIKTVFDTQYAIPNYLTSRRVNLRLKMDF